MAVTICDAPAYVTKVVHVESSVENKPTPYKSPDPNGIRILTVSLSANGANAKWTFLVVALGVNTAILCL